MPKPDGFSLSWLPSLDFSLPSTKRREEKNLRRFEELVDRAQWRKEIIGHDQVWICEEDNTFQIDLSAEREEGFSEDWTNVYPNKTAFFKPVWLKVGGVTIKELKYVYCDETRIFVPLPRKVADKHTPQSYRYEWDRRALDFKVAKIIGHYHIYETIEGVAKVSKISIVGS